MQTQVVILAAGQGKRMFSSLPKVLHHIAGRPMLSHVLNAAHAVSQRKPIVIYGHQGEVVKAAFPTAHAQWVEQREQLGTGHAVQQALPHIDAESAVLVLSGDVPLISITTLQKLVETTPEHAIGMLTADLTDPSGYGRIKRDNGNVQGIVEHKDATSAELTINEINTGIYYVPVTYLEKWLPTLKSANAQGEFYLTDIIAQAVKEQIAIHTLQPSRIDEILGVNNKMQQAALERSHHLDYATKLMAQGVTLLDPARVDFRGDVQVGKEVTIDINVIFQGRVVIGDGCVIGPNTILTDVILGDGVEVRANSVLDNAELGDGCQVGPFARIRPGTKLEANSRVGNFVELKNTTLGETSKVNHLSYLGDCVVGKRVNVGAGTITCNYDGANKHPTEIADDVHIGSGTQLVAPVKIGAGATIGAGSTVTKDVTAQSLTLTHKLEQREVKPWKRPEKVK